MQNKIRSFSATQKCKRKETMLNNIMLYQIPVFKNLQSERNYRKSQSPKKKNILCDSPYYTSGPDINKIQKLEADWKELRESLCDSDMSLHKNVTLSIRNKLSHVDTSINQINTLNSKKKILYDEDDINDEPVVIQQVKAFNVNKQVKHFIPITRISLQEQIYQQRKRAETSSVRFKTEIIHKEKSKVDEKLTDITNDNYLNKVKSRFSRKLVTNNEPNKKEENKRDKMRIKKKYTYDIGLLYMKTKTKMFISKF